MPPPESGPLTVRTVDRD